MNGKQDLLFKLKALAERGCGGEKINAQRKLEEYMAKYGITDEELEEQSFDIREFTFSGSREKALLIQIIYKVTDDKENLYFCRDQRFGGVIRSKIACRCTKSQEVEIKMLFDFYKRLYKREEKTLFFAFVQKHRLFGELKEGEEPGRTDTDELMRIIQVAKGLRDETPLKQIHGGKEND